MSGIVGYLLKLMIYTIYWRSSQPRYRNWSTRKLTQTHERHCTLRSSTAIRVLLCQHLCVASTAPPISNNNSNQQQAVEQTLMILVWTFCIAEQNKLQIKLQKHCKKCTGRYKIWNRQSKWPSSLCIKAIHNIRTPFLRNRHRDRRR